MLLRIGFDKITEMLIKNGSDVNITDEKGWSALHWAAIRGNSMNRTLT